MATHTRAARGHVVLGALTGGVIVGAAARAVRGYRRDLEAARARLAAVDRRTISTKFGALEYAESGAGEPLLVSHGIFHGCDGGLRSARDLVEDRRIIAPSRFGYLGSTLPAGATLADQADSYVLLLDHLGIAEVDVLCVSAGTTSALQLALRHPDRVKHLVILSGNLPGNPAAAAPPQWARLFYADLSMWALKVFDRPLLTRLVGVPKGFPLNATDARFVDDFIDNIFPVGPRTKGIVFDAYVSNPDVNTYQLESLMVPTLLLHMRDDPLCAFAAAQQAAARIPGAVFVPLDRGGHLGLGQAERARQEIGAFLAAAARA